MAKTLKIKFANYTRSCACKDKLFYLRVKKTIFKKTICHLLLATTLCSFNSKAQKNYFQQEVNYIIHATLIDSLNLLKASETIEYINNSPEELTFIYMHLWPNAYKNNSTALAKQLLENGKTDLYYAQENDFGYIDSLDFFINGKKVKWEYDSKHIDICKLVLNEPLRSGEKIIIETPFKVKIPRSGFSRLGGEKASNYQITQWYPKPAVYDVNGWNPMPYLDQGEFYSEYGKFDVYITIPKNYVVAATGDLVDGEEENKWLEKKAEETKSKTFERSEKYTTIIPKSDSEFKTLHFSQKNVHDFAWFADKNFYVSYSEVELPYSKRKVKTCVMFRDNRAYLWKDATKYINDGIYYYSLWNGEYPYNHATAVYGGLGAGGGMEYPNVTVIGPTSNARELETVIVHEIGHNWFYGILGSNERKNVWLDEGINSYYENRYIETKYPESSLVDGILPKKLNNIFELGYYQRRYQNYLGYLLKARVNEDQPISTLSNEFTDMNYGVIAYAKSAAVLDYLSTYLGQKVFDEAMKTYFEEWHFKHPQPADLKKIMEDVSGKNLDWFFNDIISSNKKIDYKIKAVKKLADNSYDLVLKNKTNTLSPISVYGIRNNKPVAVIWYEGFAGKQYVGFPPVDVDYFKLDFEERIPETNRNNNKIRTKGLFKKTEPLKFQFIGSFDNPNKSQVFLTPVIGYNQYNKLLAGIAFYNSILPQKKVEYLLAPMYGTGNKQLAGHANITFNFYPKGNLIQSLNLKLTANRYGYSAFPFDLNYEKITPELIIGLKKSNPRSPVKQFIRLRHINILKESFKGRYDLPDPVYTKDSAFQYFNEISYSIWNSKTINPYNVSLTYQQNKNMSKLFLTANYEVTLKGRKKSIDLRFFGGTLLGNTNTSQYWFRMSGQRGNQDYLFDDYFVGRNDYNNIFSQQFTETDGGLKVYTPLGQTDKWIAALNIKSSLPVIKFPLRIFADIGIVPEDGSVITNDNVFYDAGFMLSIFKDIFEIYFPVMMCNDMKENLQLNQVSYAEQIRFTLNLNLVHPLKKVKKLAS